MTVGVLLLLFALYEAYWTNLKSAELQDEANQNLEQRWNERTNPRGKLHPELGEAFARMYIPSFGSDYHFAILEGTDEDDLLKGPGRYLDSQMPGENGNFAVAGHRVGKGAPFNDLGKLETCDSIVIETQGEWVTYRVLPIDGQPADWNNRKRSTAALMPGRLAATSRCPGTSALSLPSLGWPPAGRSPARPC